MQHSSSVFLVGPMGSGKSAVGKALARLLGVPFYDTDAEIERRSGVAIPEIFEREGETGFRRRERDVLSELTQLAPIVLATGGGAVLDPANRAHLAGRGWVVYLEASVAEQVERTQRTRHRPLLQGVDPAERLRQLQQEREPLYREVADVVVTTDRQPVKPVAQRVARAYRARATRTGRRELSVPLGARSYPIVIGPGLLADRALLARHVPHPAVLLLTNTVVGPLYAAPLRAALADRPLVEVVLPDGEAHKSLASASRVFDVMLANRLGRDAAVLALGGGVVGDLGGFAAACYQRGIDFVQIPTTLLACVDSSVGGKTAVNHPGGKNMIGAFHQPRAVLADTDCLATLPAREFAAGMAEAIKMGVGNDAGFFDWLEQHIEEAFARSDAVVAELIERSCRIKAGIVGRDEREGGERALLNLGHTFGHAIETATGYRQFLHGEAVALGLLIAADLSARLGLLPRAAFERVRALLARTPLPHTAPPLGGARVLELMGVDKKVQGGRIRLVLLEGLGRARLMREYDRAALEATLADWFG